MPAALALHGLAKSYPGVQALKPFDLDLEAGEVHALLGENGAGKSTLIKLLPGAVASDAGRITLGGVELAGHHPATSLARGIAAIYQEFSLFPELSVAENVFYGRGRRNGPFLDRRAMIRDTEAVLRELGSDIPASAKVGSLSVGHQQIVELAKSVSRDVKVLIMDEPTAPLTTREVGFLYEAVRRLQRRGVTIIYISHRLTEIFDLCDRVTVMRDGAWVATLRTAETSETDLVRLMVGRSLDREFPPSTAAIGEVVLGVSRIASKVVHAVSFEVRAGEILGLAGLIGAGRTETARLIFGADRKAGGEIRLDGKPVAIDSPRAAIDHGIGLIPEDRKHHGVLLRQSVRFNIVYGALRRISRGLFADASAERRAAERFRRTLRIRTPMLEQLVGNLSGGNQQKVVIAKWLLTESRVLIFDEPTRGIDVGAKQEIYALMRELSRAGAAIVMISSEMPELLGMADRIVVLREGRVCGQLRKEEFDQEAVLRLASGLSLGGGA